MKKWASLLIDFLVTAVATACGLLLGMFVWRAFLWLLV